LIDEIGSMTNESIFQLLLNTIKFPLLFSNNSFILISSIPIYNLDVSKDICSILFMLYNCDETMCTNIILPFLKDNNITNNLFLVDIETAIELRSFGQPFDCNNSDNLNTHDRNSTPNIRPETTKVCAPVRMVSSLDSFQCLGAIAVTISDDPFPGSPTLMPNYFQVPVLLPLAFLVLAQIFSLNILLLNRLRLHPLRYFVPEPHTHH